MAEPSSLVWTIDDERFNRQYQVRIVYTLEPYDPGDATTPALASAVSIESIIVLRAAQFGFEGEVIFERTGPEAQPHAERVWSLLDEDEVLRAQIEEACRENHHRGSWIEQGI